MSSNFFGTNTAELPTAEQFKAKLWTPGQIDKFAELGAEVMVAMFGADEKQVKDALIADYTQTVDAHEGDVVNPEPIVSLTLSDNNGGLITPGQLVAGYNKVAGPGVEVWPQMYVGRSAAWWNQRNPEGVEETLKLNKSGLTGLIHTGGLRGRGENWDTEQAELAELVKQGAGALAVAGMIPTDWLIRDVAAIVMGDEEKLPRLDRVTITRFVQHERDITDAAGGVCGPYARVNGEQAYLRGSLGGLGGGSGFRSVVGLKKA